MLLSEPHLHSTSTRPAVQAELASVLSAHELLIPCRAVRELLDLHALGLVAAVSIVVGERRLMARHVVAGALHGQSNPCPNPEDIISRDLLVVVRDERKARMWGGRDLEALSTRHLRFRIVTADADGAVSTDTATQPLLKGYSKTRDDGD